MNLEKLESELIKIVNNGLMKLDSINHKSDNSIVTNCDVEIEKNIIIYLKDQFPQIKIISEENIESHQEIYSLKNRYAVVDPIDGTENFYFFKNIFGCAISIVYDDINYHLIYLPSENKKISTISIPDFSKIKSSIKLMSTSCIGQVDDMKDRQSKRILGSSSYMFYILLSGSAKSYQYCGKAKVWDYFTGISLALESKLNLKITFGNMVIKSLPKDVPHKCNFQIENNE
tara:strand:- start:1227 stop:1916 length:690 start_codon:yes stop_codon:yes gene_type:complete